MSADLKELLSREAQRVHPSPPPIDAMLTDVQTRVRHRRLGATAVAAALAVLAVAGPWAIGWIGEGSTVDRPADSVPSDPSWGPYRVGDTIYVGDGVSVTEKRLADRMAVVPDGVVYATETGEIVLLTQDGTKRQIGDHADTHQGPISERFPDVASDPDTGWVAWMEEPGGQDYGDMVVYDTTEGAYGEEVDRLRVGFSGDRECGTARTTSYGPFAVDDGAVYYCTGEGDFVWRPAQTAADPERILPVEGDPTTSDDYLLDVRAGRQVVLRYGDGRPSAEIMPVGTMRPATVIRGDLYDGILSHDGRYLGTLRDLRMEVYDTMTGERITPDYEAGQGPRFALAMTFTDDGEVAYALQHPPKGDANIVTCSLPGGDCESRVSDLRGGVFFANQRHQ
ncbi:MAG: hypothetical protein ACRDQD_16265 [Nocardioidaceae bacterium]